MRLIGHLGEKASALTFSDFLYVQGIVNDLEPEKEGWAIWVHGEDEVPKAKELLAQFKVNPGDPKYQKQAREANQLKEQEAKAEAKAKERYFDRTKLLEQGRTYRIGPLTVILVVACVAVAIMSRMGKNWDALMPLLITKVNLQGEYFEWAPGLPEIRHGEIWRLITPIFIHFGPPHLIFNMLATLDLGSMVEARKGTLRLALLVLVVGVVSNLAQYSFKMPELNSLHFQRGGPLFGGISGVAFGLFGYIWMKARFDPGSGFFLHRQAVMMMMVWFVICLLGIIPRVANTAHTVGLLVGVIWGYLSSPRGRR